MHYKVKIGYGVNDFMEIDNELDLQKVLYAFIAQKKVVLSDSVLDGKMILWIKPDFNKAMGWSPAHQLDSDDYLEIRRSGIEKKYNGYLESLKSHVYFLIDSGKKELIGKQPLSTNLIAN